MADGPNIIADPNRYEVVSPSGKVGSIPKENYAEAKRHGFRAATPEETNDETNRRLFADMPLGGVASALTGFVNTVLPWVGPKVMELTGGEYAKRGIQWAEKEHPYLTGLGSVAGFFTPAGAPGLIGKLGKGAEALGFGSKIAAAGLRGLAEGGAIGASDYLNKLAYLDDPADFDKFLNSTMTGATLGAAGGIGLAAAGKVIRPTLKAASNVAFKAFARAASVLNQGDYEILTKFNPLNSAGRAALREAESAPMVRRALAEEGKSILQGILDDSETVSRAMWDEKIPNVAQRLRRGAPDVAVSAATELRDAVAAKLGELAADKGAYRANDAKALLSSVGSDAKELMQKLASPGVDAEEAAFTFADSIRRRLNEAEKALDVSEPSLRHMATRKEILELNNNVVKPLLEDASIWGEAGNLQRDINRRWAQAIPAFQNVEDKLTTKLAAPGGGTKRLVNDSAWKSFAEKATRDPQDNMHGVIQDFAEQTIAATKEFTQKAWLGKEAVDAAKRVEAGVSKLSALYNKATKASIYESLLAKGAGPAAPWRSLVPYFQVGGLAFGHPATSLLAAATVPADTLNRLATLVDATSKVDSATRKLIQSTGISVRRPAIEGARRILEHQNEVKRVEKIQPEKAALPAERLGLPIAQQVQEAAERWKNYLLSRAPMATQGGGGSKTANLEWNKLLKLANKPMTELGSDRVSPAMIEHMANMYPGWLEEMRGALVAELMQNQSEDRKMPYRQRVRASVILNSKMDGTMDIRYQNELRQFYKGAQSPKRSGPKRVPDLTGSNFMATGSFSTEKGNRFQ